MVDYTRRVLKTLTNQYLTMKELKDALPEIPENSLKQYLQEHEEYLNFKKDHNRYKIHFSEIEKLKLIRKFYSEGLMKEEVNAKLEESGVRVTITHDADENTSLVSVNQEMVDMKKLISFLVQQNEQSRLQQNKIKDQNNQLLDEVHVLKHIIEEIRQAQKTDNEREAELVSFLRESLLDTQKSVAEVASSVELEKSKRFLKKLIGNIISRN